MKHLVTGFSNDLRLLFLKAVQKGKVDFIHQIIREQDEYWIGQVIEDSLETATLPSQLDFAFHLAAQPLFIFLQQFPNETGLKVVDNLGMGLLLPHDSFPHLRVTGEFQDQVRGLRQERRTVVKGRNTHLICQDHAQGPGIGIGHPEDLDFLCVLRSPEINWRIS